MLQVKQLSIGFETAQGLVKAVDDIDLSVAKGKIIGLVGESGCGKSTALFAMMGLVKHPGKMLHGNIVFNGRDISRYSQKQWRQIRGKEIAMIFQDPMTSLNPAYRVGKQIRETLKIHGVLNSSQSGRVRRRKEEKERVIELMREVGIPSPRERYDEFPHQFSGGMQQRILIAMALACEPKVILADEPTTALDVTIQAQILDLLKKINRTRGTSIVLVTHDLGVASEFTDELAVMYAGQIVEQGPTAEVIANPRHPYTQGLLRSIPKITRQKEKIEPIAGNVIDLTQVKDECNFLPRCPYAAPSCRSKIAMASVNENHIARCARIGEGDRG